MPTKQVSLCRCQSPVDSAYMTGVFESLSVTGETVLIRQVSLCRCRSPRDSAYMTDVFVSLSVTERHRLKCQMYDTD